MQKGRRLYRFTFLILIIVFGVGVISLAALPARGYLPAAQQPGPSAAVEISGTLSLIWGDSRPGQPGDTRLRAFLTDDAGQTVELLLDEETLGPAGGLAVANGRLVSVSGQFVPDQSADGQGRETAVPLLKPATVFPHETSAPSPVLGSKPFVSVLCQFQDIAYEPHQRSYFQEMYSEAQPGLSHFWRELSYEQADLLGSDAFGWYVLPRARSAYFRTDGSLKLGELFDDCAGAAQADVDFSAFEGINLMFNAELDGYAWGGTIFKALDGQGRMWRATWQPPWAFENLTVVAHEMGHAFGLPHSSGEYGHVYDNRWDVMSDMWSDCSRAMDASFGCLGQHTIAFHKGILGWLDGRVYTASSPQQTIALQRLAHPDESGYLAARIPIDISGQHFYTVEVREQVGYDGKLPISGVVIHEVNLNRNIPAHVIDEDLNGDTGDAGAQWLPGEVFSGKENIKVSIDSSTGSSVTVTITRPDLAGGQLPQTFYLSTTRSGKLDGLAFDPSDIVRYDRDEGLSMLFDGSDVGISKNLSGFAFDGDGSILLSLSGSQSVPGLGTVRQQEVFRFQPTSLGEETEGTFAWVLRRSDSGLTTTGEKVDALALKTATCWPGDASSGLMVSTNGRAVVNDSSGARFKAQDEDIILHDDAWSHYFDGSSVPGLGREDINGLWQDPVTCDLYVTIIGSYNLGGVRGNGKDIVRLHAVHVEDSPAVSFEPSLFWDGSAAGFPRNLDSIEFPNAIFP